MSELRATPGPWDVFNMVHADHGGLMTPEEVGEYVTNAIKANSECSDFLFVSAKGDDGDPVDVCHVGNGPKRNYNAALIGAAPDLYAALEACNPVPGGTVDRMRKEALAKARGKTA